MKISWTEATYFIYSFILKNHVKYKYQICDPGPQNQS